MSVTQYDEEFFNGLFDAQPQPVFWLKPVRNNEESIVDFEYRYCNREMGIMTAMPVEAILGNTLLKMPVLPDDLKRRFFEQSLTVYNTGEKIEDTVYNPRLKKYYSFVRTKAQDGVLIIITDRTAEYQMIQDMRKKNLLLDNILKHSSSGISVTEVIRNSEGEIVDGRTIMANEASVAFTGIPQELHQTKTLKEIDPAMLESTIYQMAINTLKTGEPFHTQYYFEPSGKWLDLSVSKMDEDHLINIFTDITTTREAQLKLEAAGERFKKVFNAAQAGMFIFEPVQNNAGEVIDFRFVITNPAFAAYVGQTPEALNGELGSTWFPGYMTNGVFDMYKHTWQTGEMQRKDVHYNVDGLNIYLDLLSTKVNNEVLVTFIDYTPLKHLQLQLEHKVAELQRANANLEEFTYAASHDLQEPLRKIHYFADSLKKELQPCLQQSGLQKFGRMEDATRRMRGLIDDLLAYSLTGMNNEEFTEVNLEKVVREVMDDMEVSIEERNAVINVDGLPKIKGNKRQLRQMFQNLIGNSLKYAKEDTEPQISITCRCVKGSDEEVTCFAPDGARNYYLIKVADNGIGFMQENAAKVFKVFQRLHGRSEYSGTGVGLAIVKKVVENQSGCITVEAEPDNGATFKILFPATP